MKKVMVIAACIATVVALSGCGSSVKNSTPEDAFRSLIIGLTRADSKTLALLVKEAAPVEMVVNGMLADANRCGVVGTDIADYELSKENDRYVAIDKKANRKIWVRLILVDGKYYANQMFISDIRGGGVN